MKKNVLINPNPKPKHRILTRPRRGLRLVTINRLEYINLGNEILRIRRNNRVINGCAGISQVVGEDEGGVLGSGQVSHPIGTTCRRASSWMFIFYKYEILLGRETVGPKSNNSPSSGFPIGLEADGVPPLGSNPVELYELPLFQTVSPLVQAL